MVGVAGFEPAASCSQGTRANQAALHPEHAVYKTLGEKWQVPTSCNLRTFRAEKDQPRTVTADQLRVACTGIF
jgi:hypothetical protein